MRCQLAIALLALAACEAKSGSGTANTKVAESGTQKGSAGGFSAHVSAELAKAGVGDPVGATPAPAPAAGSGSTDGSAATATGSDAGSAAATPAAGSASQSAATPTAAGSAATPTAAGSAATPTPAGSASAPAPTPTPPPTPAGSASTPTPAGKTGAMTATNAEKPAANRAYMKPSADIAAIKLDLEPNWERDMGEAGTFSLVLKIPSTDDTRVFSVRYGYDDQNAPIDCDQYRKFLEERGTMKVTLNRQKGGACYIEGTDQAGVVAFRMMQTYGGKRLLCHGSLYKDPASSALGDLRDKVLMQAKKICETLAL